MKNSAIEYPQSKFAFRPNIILSNNTYILRFQQIRYFLKKCVNRNIFGHKAKHTSHEALFTQTKKLGKKHETRYFRNYFTPSVHAKN